MSNTEAPTALSKVPENPNFLSQGGFRLVVKRLPNVNFFATKVNIPTISIQPTAQPNPFVVIPHSGEHIDYDELNITFKIDENLQNYLEIHNWIKALGFPDNFRQYRELKGTDQFFGEGLKSEISIFILTSHRNANYEVIFRDAFPVSLSGFELDSTLDDVDYLDSTTIFKYTSYKIVKVT